MSIPQGQSDNRPACAACKHQRRKCAEDCVFAEHFPAEKTEDFKNALEVFGVKNMARILNSLGSSEEREKAVASIVWEAKLWKEDPVNGPLGAYFQRDQLPVQTRVFRPFLMDSAGLINNANERNNILGNYIIPERRMVKYEQQGPNCHNVTTSAPFDKYPPGQRLVISSNQGPPPVNYYHMGFGVQQDDPIHGPMFVHCRPNNDGRISGSILDVDFQGGCIGTTNYAAFVDRLRQSQGREDGVRDTSTNRTTLPLNQANINEGYNGHQ